jgi:hypothetical protein
MTERSRHFPGAEPELLLALAALDDVSVTGDTFDPAALVRAAGLLHALGHDGCHRALSLYAEQADLGPSRAGGELYARRPIFAARLLYVAREGGEALPPPALGKPDVDLDPALCPLWPLVVSAAVPFLPLGDFAIGGAPTSAARYVALAARAGRLRDQPLRPLMSPADAADRLIGSASWHAAVPDRHTPYARSLVYGQAMRASLSAIAADEGPLIELATAGPEDLDATWNRLSAALPLRDLSWDPTDGRFVAPSG